MLVKKIKNSPKRKNIRNKQRNQRAEKAETPTNNL